MSLANKVKEHFIAAFAADPAFIVRSPGRVNLIGEHTDYNDGFVFPLAIDRATFIALRPRDDNRVLRRFLSIWRTAANSPWTTCGSPQGSRLDRLSDRRRLGLARTRIFAAWLGGGRLRRCADRLGLVVVSGAGAGCCARAFHCVSGFDWDARAMALACQRRRERVASASIAASWTR